MADRVVPMIHVPDVRTSAEWYVSIGFELSGMNEADGWLGRLRPRTGEMTLVLTRGGDRWQVVSAQNTDAAPPIGAPGEWLVLAVIGGGLGACIAAVAGATVRGTIAGSVTGMFVAAPLVVLLYADAPIAGGVFGFGVLGSAIGLAVALLRRFFARLLKSTQSHPRSAASPGSAARATGCLKLLSPDGPPIWRLRNRHRAQGIASRRRGAGC